jgi:hypothetical protein
MKSRVEHNRLWNHQHPPAKVDECEGDVRVLDLPKVGKDLFDTTISSASGFDKACNTVEGLPYNEERLRQNSLRAHEAGPEIQTPLSQIREPQPHIELDTNVPSRADKGGHGHGDCQVILEVLGHAHVRER